MSGRVFRNYTCVCVHVCVYVCQFVCVSMSSGVMGSHQLITKLPFEIITFFLVSSFEASEGKLGYSFFTRRHTHPEATHAAK